jgi:hypothetical protein
MGKGFLKERNKVRSDQFNAMVREANRLEAENRELKTNPDGVVGKFLNKLNTLAMQNNKLSALSASLIKTAGGSVKVPRSLIEGFGGHRVVIKVEGNAEKEEDTTEYLFTYEAEKVEASETPVVVTDSTPIDAPLTVTSLDGQEED